MKWFLSQVLVFDRAETKAVIKRTHGNLQGDKVQRAWHYTELFRSLDDRPLQAEETCQVFDRGTCAAKTFESWKNYHVWQSAQDLGEQDCVQFPFFFWKFSDRETEHWTQVERERNHFRKEIKQRNQDKDFQVWLSIWGSLSQSCFLTASTKCAVLHLTLLLLLFFFFFLRLKTLFTVKLFYG